MDQSIITSLDLSNPSPLGNAPMLQWFERFERLERLELISTAANRRRGRGTVALHC